MGDQRQATVAPSQTAQAVAGDIAAATSMPSQSDSPTTTSSDSPQVVTEVRNAQAEMVFNPFEDSGKTESVSFEKIVPEAYKEKEWVKNLSKNPDATSEFFKQFEHAQSLIGSKISVPPPDAPPEQVKAFHKALGVPDDIRAYEVKPVGWTPEDKQLGEAIAKSRPEPFMNEMKLAAQEAGITPQKFQQLVDRHDRAVLKMMKDGAVMQNQALQANDLAFDKLMDQIHGQEKTQILDRGRKMIESLVSPQVRPFLARVNNEGLAVLSDVLGNGVYKAYVKEDGFNTGAGTASPLTSGMESRKALIALQKTDAYKNAMHPDHEAIVKKVNAGYANLPEDALNKALTSLV